MNLWSWTISLVEQWIQVMRLSLSVLYCMVVCGCCVHILQICLLGSTFKYFNFIIMLCSTPEFVTKHLRKYELVLMYFCMTWTISYWKLSLDRKFTSKQFHVTLMSGTFCLYRLFVVLMMVSTLSYLSVEKIISSYEESRMEGPSMYYLGIDWLISYFDLSCFQCLEWLCVPHWTSAFVSIRIGKRQAK